MEDDRKGLMKRIGIIGSCVTRDVWHILNMPTDNIKTFSRTSLASLMSPVPEKLSLPGGMGALKPGGFLARCVRADVEKTALGILEAWQPNVLIFDFLDERFDLLRVGDAVISDSFEFWRSGLRARAPFTNGQPIHRLSAEADQLWNGALAALCKRIVSGPLVNATIVLHVALWADFYRMEGELKRFPEQMKINPVPRAPEENIAKYNSLLKGYHEAFMNTFPNAIVVMPPKKYRIGDTAHAWGPSPHHYIADYYRSFRELCQVHGLTL
jgi:hypothetical protein